MSNSAQKFIEIANFYNQLTMIMTAIAVQKGGIPMENYVGRFFAADVLEFIVEYGKRLQKNKIVVQGMDIKTVVESFEQEFSKVKELVTPTQKPIYEMTLEEFEKIMNI